MEKFSAVLFFLSLLFSEVGLASSKKKSVIYPLHNWVFRVDNNRERSLKEILNSDTKIDSKNQKGEAALHIAIRAPSSSRVIKLLLKHKANPNIKDKKGKTPLHHAIMSGFLPEAKILMREGANPNIKDHKGNTPLHYASKRLDFYFILVLLNNEANPFSHNMKLKKPWNILKIAEKKKQKSDPKYKEKRTREERFIRKRFKKASMGKTQSWIRKIFKEEEEVWGTFS